MTGFFNDYWGKLEKVKELAHIGSSEIMGRGISAIFWFYIASQVGPEIFGQLSFILGIVSFADAFSSIGTQNSVTVYAAKKIHVISPLYIISIIIGSISTIILAIVFNRIDFVPLILGYILSNFAIGYLLGKRFSKKFFKFTLIQKILTVVFGIATFYIFGYEWILFGVGLSFLIFIFPIRQMISESNFNFKELIPRKGFIINNYILQILGRTNGNIDKLIIVPLLGFIVLGNFSLAFQVLAVMMVVSQVVFKVILPRDSTGKKSATLKKGTMIIGMIITVIAIGLAPTVIPPLFPKFEQAIEPIQILSLCVIPGTINTFYLSKFLGIEKSKIILISYVISICILSACMIILGEIFGINGLAIAVVFSSIGSCLFLLAMDKKYFKERHGFLD